MTKLFSSRAVRAASVALALTVLAPASLHAKNVVQGMQPVQGAEYENFSAYSIRFEEFGTGPDGHYQAVVTVRNNSSEQMGFTSNDLDLTLISAENEPLKDDGNMYDGRAMGPLSALVRIQDTIRMEPKEQVRVRFAFNNSNRFPVKTLRLRETAKDEGVVIYAVAPAPKAAK